MFKWIPKTVDALAGLVFWVVVLYAACPGARPLIDGVVGLDAEQSAQDE